MILDKLSVKPLLIALGLALLALTVLSGLYAARGNTIDAQAQTIDAQADALRQAGQSLRDAADANRAASGVIKDLNRRLAEAIGQNQAVEEANRRARDELIAARRARTKAIEELNHLKEVIYETDANAAAWARQPVPGAIADQLHERWNAIRAGQADDRGNAGAAIRGSGSDTAGGRTAAGAAEAGSPGILGLPGRLPEQPAAGGGPLDSPELGRIAR